MKTTFRKCLSDDMHLLQDLSCKTYHEAFCHMNTPENMTAYLEQAFNIDKLYRELLDNNSLFYFLYSDEILTGYLKLNESSAQTDIHDPKSLELERIYVLKDFQGNGFGNILMNKAVQITNERDKSYIWLGVWEKNHNALLFYKKNGFYKIGQHIFTMGEDKQTDFLMRKDLQLITLETQT